MTQEEKQLLLKDLCARLPYGVIVRISSESDVCLYVSTSTLDIDTLHKYMLDGGYYKNGLFYKTPGFQLLPYLRPMSGMTEEEKDELYTAMDWYGEIDESGNVYIKGQEKVYRETFYEYTDWLNAHHFDYRGLIEKGLALEAPEDMYK